MCDTDKRIVVALGGNAISKPNQEGTIAEQFINSQHTARVLVDAVAAGYRLVVTHGNGPQVGNILRRAEIALSELYMVPLEICVADTQAGMGFMIGQCLGNEMRSRDMQVDITTIVTSVLVDRHDDAFVNPTKPIGAYLTKEQADERVREEGWTMVEVADGRWRRVVPSPPPLRILELDTIRKLVNDGQLVIACGGGGIPVIEDDQGDLHGTAAVIDKDRTSALLARRLDADMLVILTAVDHVCINFGKDNEQALERLTIEEARGHLADGQFAAGSMGPKVEAAIEFVEQSPRADAVAIIAALDKLTEALQGTSGTRIVRA
jgi:carbamate kinase